MYKPGSNYITLHDSYNTLLYFTLIIRNYAAVHDTTVHYAMLTTSEHSYNCNCNYTDYVTLQLLLHHTTTTSALHHCNQCSRCEKHSYNQFSVHQVIRSAICDSQQPTSRIGFTFFKLKPTPCAVVLLVFPLAYNPTSSLTHYFDK